MKKPTSIPVSHEALEYAPTAGTKVPSALSCRGVDNRLFGLLLRIFIMIFIVRGRRASILSRYKVGWIRVDGRMFVSFLEGELD